ncbi:MAG: Poly(hydroxyalcanoate) granule associated protein (phasin) [Planctomycetes bacterium ADurb.Bin126]|nr:MAG: Poly(hydroxyalcanoate) granule associated protein (phasin) [Planctomycetes bacterium ADurb.Bin126]HOD81806.1 phasin family protein [Phycisphaerae bacterium]HQL75799.1 phasin family protein [Phycisphaerae bacterium]
MLESLDRLLLAGLGALSMTRERAEQIFDDYVRRGQVEKERRTGFVREMVEMAEKSRQDFENLITRQVREAVDKLNLPTRDDLARIEAKLDAVLAQNTTP